jgi:hypothetical protein
MSVVRTLKTLAGVLVAITTMTFMSYCSEWPKYSFGQRVNEAVQNLPGARVIDKQTVIDVTSPIEWFWPPVTTWTFAVPDPLMRDRFFTTTAIYEEKNPIIYLVDVDCQDRSAIRYDLDEPDSAVPARTMFGDPVVAENGKIYRRIPAKIESAYPEPRRFIDAFCDADWSAARDAIGHALYGSKGPK